MTETVHACPRGDGALTTCCRKTPFELPWGDRMTLDPDRVTCNRTAALDFGGEGS